MYYYCERTTDSFLSEPLNSITNLAFLIAAIFIYKKYRDQVYVYVFTFSILFIGIGSFLFHTIPSKITGLVDILFILLFILIYIYLISNCLLKFNKLYSASHAFISPFLYFYLGGILKSNFLFLGDSSFYIIILIHLYIIFLISLIKKIDFNINILIAALIFTLSISFRAVDHYFCDENLNGTHFIWHIFNSLVLYILVNFFYKVLIQTSSPKIPS